MGVPMIDLVAAVFLAGPGATDDELLDQVIRLSLMAEETSPFSKRLARVMGAARFVAELVAVDIEPSSTRAVLTLRSDSADSEDGTEQIRSDRTDQSDGRRLAAQAAGLVGRRVVVFKVLEDIGPTKKVRVCVHLLDIGPIRDQWAASGGHWARRHWEEAAASAGVTPERVLEAARHYAGRIEPYDLPSDLDGITTTVGDHVRRWLDKQRAAK